MCKPIFNDSTDSPVNRTYNPHHHHHHHHHHHLTYVVDAINKGIVATIAHGQPVATEPDDANEVIVVDFRDRNIENIIELQWQPAESKDNDHDNKHFDDLQVGRKKRKLNCDQICIHIPPSNTLSKKLTFFLFFSSVISRESCALPGARVPHKRTAIWM